MLVILPLLRQKQKIGGNTMESLPNGQKRIVLQEPDSGDVEEIEEIEIVKEVEHGLDHDTSASDNPVE